MWVQGILGFAVSLIYFYFEELRQANSNIHSLCVKECLILFGNNLGGQLRWILGTFGFTHKCKCSVCESECEKKVLQSVLINITGYYWGNYNHCSSGQFTEDENQFVWSVWLLASWWLKLDLCFFVEVLVQSHRSCLWHRNWFMSQQRVEPVDCCSTTATVDF